MREAASHKIPSTFEMDSRVAELCAALDNPLAAMLLVRLWRNAVIDPANNTRFSGPHRVATIEGMVRFQGKRGAFVEAAKRHFLREDGDSLWVIAPEDVFKPQDNKPKKCPSRASIFERDGNACRYCGATEKLSIDHILPRSYGGTDYAENLVVCCRSCNSKKRDRTPEQAGMAIRPLPGGA